jgi:hypothetical protein
MADDDKIIDIIGAADAVEGLRQMAPGFEDLYVYDRPWSGEPGTLDLQVPGPVASVRVQFGTGATAPFARHLADATRVHRLLLFDPKTNTETILGLDTEVTEIARLLRDDDLLNPS